jgi:hypothetical protein
MSLFRTPSRNRIEGISFEVPELMLLAAWSDFHGFAMRIELDWHVDEAEYEEVVTLHRPDRASPHWLLWRTSDTVVLQPVIGRARRFEAITEALAAIRPDQP